VDEEGVMALRSHKKARPSGEASSQWLSLDQARAILGVASEDIVRLGPEVSLAAEPHIAEWRASGAAG
jgi:hypothetical protein